MTGEIVGVRTVASGKWAPVSRSIDEPAYAVTGGGRNVGWEFITEESDSEAASNPYDAYEAMGDVRTSHGCVRDMDQPSMTITSALDNGNARFVLKDGEIPPVYVNGNQANAARRSIDEPAPTVMFGARMNDVRWVDELDPEDGQTPPEGRWFPTPAIEGETSEQCDWVSKRPSPTIVGSFNPDVVAKPGWRGPGDGPRQKASGSVRVTVVEAGILQGMPADHPWEAATTKTKQFEIAGNLVIPCVQEALTRHLFACDDEVA